MGCRHWDKNKLEAEALINEQSPDLLFISEANVMATLPEMERHVEGYTLPVHLLDTMTKHGYALIILLVKYGIDSPHLIVPDPKNQGQFSRIHDSSNFRVLDSNL